MSVVVQTADLSFGSETSIFLVSVASYDMFAAGGVFVGAVFATLDEVALRDWRHHVERLMSVNLKFGVDRPKSTPKTRRRSKLISPSDMKEVN